MLAVRNVHYMCVGHTHTRTIDLWNQRKSRRVKSFSRHKKKKKKTENKKTSNKGFVCGFVHFELGS